MGGWKGVVWYGKPLLPFWVLITIDSSGSLTPDDVPEVYTAFDEIYAAYNVSPLFPGIAAEDFLVIIPDDPAAGTFEDPRVANERFMQWFKDFPADYRPDGAPARCLLIAVANEAAPVYHTGTSSVSIASQYNSDFTAFDAAWPGNGLIKGAILQTEGSFSSEDISGGAALFGEFLDAAFNDPSSAGSSVDPITTAFISEFDDEPLIDTTYLGWPSAIAASGDTVVTVASVYNAIVSRINFILTADGSPELPYPYGS